jgi:glyoxylase-like metal-dependent hydrolase (beta-lactamase superfamily II)
VGLFNDEADVDALIEGVRTLQTRSWKGRYKVKAEGVSAEFLGRCNDSWMESTEPAEPAVTPEQHAPENESFIFEQLNPAGPCKCYLVADRASGKAMLVDPRRDFVDHYLQAVKARGLTLAMTVETHTHADHLSGSKRIKDLTRCSMAMHASATAPCVDRHLQDGDTLELGELSITVWATPGHTEDSIALLLPDRVLTGDTMLLGASGRTDLGGDSHAQFRSLQRLRELPPELQVWPGHDYKGRSFSTVGEQIEHNPRLQIQDESQFCALMDQLNLPPPQKLEEALAANKGCL